MSIIQNMKMSAFRRAVNCYVQWIFILDYKFFQGFHYRGCPLREVSLYPLLSYCPGGVLQIFEVLCVTVHYATFVCSESKVDVLSSLT